MVPLGSLAAVWGARSSLRPCQHAQVGARSSLRPLQFFVFLNGALARVCAHVSMRNGALARVCATSGTHPRILSQGARSSLRPCQHAQVGARARFGTHPRIPRICFNQADQAEVVSRSAARTPPSTRAGGQDDGSLNKLPQISFLRHQSKAELGRMRKYSPSSVSDEPGVEASRAYCSTSKRRSKSSFSCRRIANPRRSSPGKT